MPWLVKVHFKQSRWKGNENIKHPWKRQSIRWWMKIDALYDVMTMICQKKLVKCKILWLRCPTFWILSIGMSVDGLCISRDAALSVPQPRSSFADDNFTTTLHLHPISLHLSGPRNLDPVRQSTGEILYLVNWNPTTPRWPKLTRNAHHELLSLHPPLRQGFPYAHRRPPCDHGPSSSCCHSEQDPAEGVPCPPSADGTHPQTPPYLWYLFSNSI